jgi:hypothetical protein
MPTKNRMGGHQDYRTGYGSILQRGNPQSEVETKEEAGEEKPSQFLSLPCSPWFFIASERGQHQGGEHEPIGGDDQSWRIAELDEY